MSFFNRIFSDKRNKSKEAPKKPESSIVIPEVPTAEYARLLQFTQRLNSLLLEDRYLARSDYKQIIDEYADINTFFKNQKTGEEITMNVGKTYITLVPDDNWNEMKILK